MGILEEALVWTNGPVLYIVQASYHFAVLIRQLVVGHTEVGATNVKGIAGATLFSAGWWQSRL